MSRRPPMRCRRAISRRLSPIYLKACKAGRAARCRHCRPAASCFPATSKARPRSLSRRSLCLSEGKAPKGSLLGDDGAPLRGLQDPSSSNPSSANILPGSTARSFSIDALQAMNRGPEAIQDLERALTDVLACFRPGTNSAACRHSSAAGSTAFSWPPRKPIICITKATTASMR